MHPRSFTFDAAAAMLLAVIVWITLVLVGQVRAEPQTRTFKDSMGREVGRSTTRGNTTTFQDRMGRETGRAERRPDGSTNFYDDKGRMIGTSRGGPAR